MEMKLEDSYKIGEMLNTLERALAVRDGRTRRDDILYDIYFEKEDAGGRKYIREDLERAKSDYYRLMGWDVKTGTPTGPTLEKLGLKEVAEGLEKKGLLGKKP
jgi:aldehyde:ferredoxin oxidoreductase